MILSEEKHSRPDSGCWFGDDSDGRVGCMWTSEQRFSYMMCFGDLYVSTWVCIILTCLASGLSSTEIDMIFKEQAIILALSLSQTDRQGYNHHLHMLLTSLGRIKPGTSMGRQQGVACDS